MNTYEDMFDNKPISYEEFLELHPSIKKELQQPVTKPRYEDLTASQKMICNSLNVIIDEIEESYCK